jgi:hypothetical protein
MHRYIKLYKNYLFVFWPLIIRILSTRCRTATTTTPTSSGDRHWPKKLWWTLTKKTVMDIDQKNCDGHWPKNCDGHWPKNCDGHWPKKLWWTLTKKLKWSLRRMLTRRAFFPVGRLENLLKKLRNENFIHSKNKGLLRWLHGFRGRFLRRLSYARPISKFARSPT